MRQHVARVLGWVLPSEQNTQVLFCFPENDHISDLQTHI